MSKLKRNEPRAEPVARANAGNWHVGCGAAFGAKQGRGSAVTFGKNMHKHAIASVISVLFMVGVAVAAPASVTRLGWLAGTWQFEKDGRVVTEIWMAPEGKTMLGMSRTVVAGATKEYEFVILREDGDRIVYVAKLSGQEETTFVLRSMTGVEAIFENQTHDFPQLISYRLSPDGILLATVEGTVRGKLKRIEFSYRRVQ